MTRVKLLGGTMLAAGAITGAMLLAAPASAQEQTTPTPASGAGPVPSTATGKTTDSDAIAEVVVTARKRQERLQDVPLAITAVTAETLRDTGVTTLKGVLALTPGVTLDGGSAENNQVPVIRGQYNLNNAPGSGGQPNVAIFLDGIYLQNSSAISVGLLDLERVEIVKGPVSALYGRNGFAGAINYVSKKPTDTVQSTGVAQFGEFGTVNLDADVNGPIVAGLLRGGLAVNYQTSDGGYEDSVTHLRAGGFEKKDIKGTFDFTPTPHLDISGGYYYGDDHFDQATIVNGISNCASGRQYCGEFVAQPLEVGAIPASSGNSGNNRDVQSGNLRINYDLGFADATYLGGYNRVKERSYQDFTGYRNGLSFLLSPGPGSANIYELFGADDNTEDWQHELRLTSKQDQSFRWSVGGDYFDSNTENTTLIGLNASQIPAGQALAAGPNYGYAALFLTPDGRPSSTNFTETTTKEKTYSFFGSFDYDFLTRLTLSAEVRYTHDKQSLDILRNAFISNTVRPYGTVAPIDFSYANYRTTLKYKFTPQTMAYVSIASGTKAGGYNGRATIASELSYGPEDNTTYEVGAKTEMFNSRLQLDVAVYHIDSSDLQINGLSDDPKNVGQVVKNFGGTENTGFELTAVAKPMRDLVLSAGFAYTDPEFSSGTNDVNGVAICTLVPSCAGRITTIQTARGPMQSVDLQGLQLQRASKYQLNLNADYRHSITNSLEGFAHADFRYESKQFSGLEDFYYIGDRELLNVRVGVERGPYTVALFIRNLLDDRTPIFPTQASELNDFHNQFEANLPDPRMVGGELSYRF